MDIQEVIDKLKEALDLAENLQESQLNEMGNFYTKLSFPDFRKECLRRYELKKAGKSFKYQDTALVKLVKGVDIYDTCIEHVYKDHKNMTPEIWQIFLDTFSPIKDVKEKAKYNGKRGKRYVYKCGNQDYYFGYVLDIIEGSNPKLVTVFYDHPNSVDNWFNNVVNGNVQIDE